MKWACICCVVLVRCNSASAVFGGELVDEVCRLQASVARCGRHTAFLSVDFQDPGYWGKIGRHSGKATVESTH